MEKKIVKRVLIPLGIACVLVLVLGLAGGFLIGGAGSAGSMTDSYYAVDNGRYGGNGIFADGAMAKNAPMAAAAPMEMREEAAMDYAAAETTAASAAASGSGSAGTPAVQAPERKLIKNVNLSIETLEFDTLVSTITAKVESLGGYVQDSWIQGESIQKKRQTSGTYIGRTANITARVPAERLDDFVTNVSSSGNVTAKSESVSDMTLQYMDIESRKKSLETERERLWELMSKAESVDAVITIQSRISEIEYQLDSFSSQLRLYDNQVDYATVYMDLSEVKTYSPTPEEKESIVSRMIRGLQDTLDGLAEFFQDLLVGLVSMLPVIALLAVFIGIVMAVIRSILRRGREKKEKRKAEETAAAAEAAAGKADAEKTDH